MSSKKSDHSDASAAAAEARVPIGAASADSSPLAPRHDPAARSSRLDSLKSNGPLPVLLLLLPLLGWFLERSDYIDTYFVRIVILIGINIILAVGLQLINGFSGQFSLGHAGFMAVGAYMAAYPANVYSNKLQDPGAVVAFYLSLGLVLLIAGAALAGVFSLLRLSRRVWRQLPALLMVLVVVWIVWDIARASRFDTPPAYFIWSKSASVLALGFGWLVEHAAPLAGKMSSLLPPAGRPPLAFMALILGGGLFAAAMGLLVGLPTLRLRGDYLAIATLGFAEIIRIAFSTSKPLGEALGLNGIPTYTNFAWLYAAVLLCVVVVWRVAYSATGRAILAVREDEIAAAAVGINPTRYKVIAFVLGAFWAGIAGALYAMNASTITPKDFGPQKSIEVVVIVTLGGLGSISGAIVAAVVLTLLPEILRPIAEYRMVIYALLLIGMMLIRPQGLLGGRELWPRRRRRASADSSGADDDAASTRGSNDQNALEVRDASRRFGGLAALSAFSLRIARGELVGLIGPNGAGKTTAFNLVTGVYAPTGGTIHLGGRQIDGLAPFAINRHGVARTFQNIRLFKSLSALDNVAAGFNRLAELRFLRTILRTPRFYRERRSTETSALHLLKTLEMSRQADHAGGSLPYGDQRRLEIARALATGPTILLLDEPAAGMNPQEKARLMDLIRFIRDRFDVGVLLIEHDMKLVMGICERIAVLDHGETIAAGAPAEVQAHPAVIEAYLGEPIS